MQSHTFTRARGVAVPIGSNCVRNDTSDRPSTSKGASASAVRRSKSLAPLNRTRAVTPKDARGSAMPSTFVPKFHNEESLRRMPYRCLGNTDIHISAVAFGCGPIGGLFGNVEDSIVQIIETALRNGINFIDTAYWYGQARSEEILGKVLQKIPRKAYYIATKVGRFELDYARTFDFRADKILESLTKSLKRLRLPYVDVCFVQIHDVEFEPNESIILYESLPALQIAKQSGKIRHIGLTGYPLNKLASVVENSSVPIDVVMTYCHGSLNDNALGAYVHFFESKNVGIINGAPLSMGLLTEKGPPPWHPASPAIREVTLAAIQYCASKEISIEKLALHYGINFAGVCSCVVGMDSVPQVLMNVDTACSPLRPVEIRLRDRLIRRYFDRLENANWEGVHVHQYWRRLKKLGLTALATHRHSSVESLASTMTNFSFSQFG